MSSVARLPDGDFYHSARISIPSGILQGLCVFRFGVYEQRDFVMFLDRLA